MARRRRRGSGFRRFVTALLTLFGAAAAMAGIFLYLYWQDFSYPAQADVAAVTARTGDPGFVERGRYLTAAGDCVACHTAEGGQPFAGGLGLPTLFGTIYAPNITPDPETGIGGWTDREFVRALHKGIGRRGQQLYPAFPYTSYTKLSIEDALAIKAYLFTLDPVTRRTPETALPFPFNQRILLRFWNMLFFEEGRFRPAPERDQAWNRGAYLVEALGHCGDCHTPRNLLQGPGDAKFAGAAIEDWWAYNITPAHNAGIGGWSAAELEQYLATGAAPGDGRASGPMAEVVQYSTSRLSDGDRKAMVAYLRSVPPVERGASQPRNTWGAPAADAIALRGRGMGGDVEPEGARLFVGNCASCHGWSGGGVAAREPAGYPALFHNGNVGGDSTGNVLQVILHGVSRKMESGEVFMPGFADVLDDRDIAELVNYVLRQFGDPANATIKPEDVAELRGRR